MQHALERHAPHTYIHTYILHSHEREFSLHKSHTNPIQTVRRMERKKIGKKTAKIKKGKKTYYTYIHTYIHLDDMYTQPNPTLVRAGGKSFLIYIHMHMHAYINACMAEKAYMQVWGKRDRYRKSKNKFKKPIQLDIYSTGSHILTQDYT